MRGELIRFANGVTVIDDSYNSNPQALLQSVRAVAKAKGFLRRIVIAGEMLELGGMGEALHQECGREIAALEIDRLVGVRGLAAEMVKSASQEVPATFCQTPEEAAEILIAEARAGDLVLIKGSRGVRMEKAIERLRDVFET
jgi:UDP-N-acetylmuramoyl-tripeptide--D-alanyl-D-alanine ligase